MKYVLSKDDVMRVGGNSDGAGVKLKFPKTTVLTVLFVSIILAFTVRGYVNNMELKYIYY